MGFETSSSLFIEGHFAGDKQLDLEGLRDAVNGDTQKFEQLVVGLQSEFEAELRRLAQGATTKADRKELEEMAQEIGSAFNELNGNFHSLMSYRIGVNTMRIYINSADKS